MAHGPVPRNLILAEPVGKGHAQVPAAGGLVAATEPQHERLFAAQRAETKARLVHLGMAADLADRWLKAWEGSSNMRAERYSADFWERGGRWSLDAWVAGQQPPTIEP